MIPTRDVCVTPSGAAAGTVAAPASKSVTNRLLVLAALAEGTSVLTAALDSDDSVAMRRVVEGLGARVRAGPDGLVVDGTGGRPTPETGALDAGLSGTTMRFGVALACLAATPVTIGGMPPLLRRPVGPLVAALAALGARVADTAGFPPVTAGGAGLRGGPVTVDVRRSSQFASAILLVAPYADDDVVLRLAGPSATDYVAMTAQLMTRWGAEVSPCSSGWQVTAGRGYRPRQVTVEHDASAAAHLLALAAATGGTVTVPNATATTSQPDAAVPAVLARLGCEVTSTGEGVTVTGPERLQPIDVDLAAMPDQVTTVAALAALAEGASELRGVAVARTHETDRLAALATELRKLGIEVVERDDGLRIVGGHARGPARLETYDDHRLAMAFAALAARVPGVTIAEPWCVTKTYPRFWVDLSRLGVRWHECGATT